MLGDGNTPDSDPGAGEPYGIRYLARLRSDKAEAMRVSISAIVRAREQPTSREWQAKSRTAFTDRTNTIVVDLSFLATGLEQVAFALNRYAAQVEQIKAAQVGLIGSHLRATQNINHDLRRLAVLDITPLPLFDASERLDKAIRTDPADAPEVAAQRASLWNRIDDESAHVRAAERSFADLVSERRRADALCISAMEGKTVTGGLWSTTPSTIKSESDAALLRHLAGLSSTDLAVMLQLHPELRLRIAAITDAPAVAAWWRGLGGPFDPLRKTELQLAVISLLPEAIGNLEEVAYWARSEANVARLHAALEDASRSDRTTDRISALNAIFRALEENIESRPKMLISFTDDRRDVPLAAISVGDLDRARYVTFQISGMDSSTVGMVGSVKAASALRQNAVSIAERVKLQGEIAVVAWIGYRSPDTGTVSAQKHANAGALLLNTALEGFRATTAQASGTPFLAVNAHSYGSTVAMKSLVSTTAQVNALAMYGSAGAPAEVTSIHDLRVPSANIWVGNTSTDGTAFAGRLASGRADPHGLDGTSYFGTDGGVRDPETGIYLEKSNGHSEYLKTDTESMHNLAAINLDLRGSVILEGAK